MVLEWGVWGVREGERRTYNDENELLPGPKGWKGSQTVSAAKIDTPSFLCVVTTMRVGGIVDAIADS